MAGSTAQATNRLPLPDLARGLGCLFIVQVHVSENIATEGIYDSTLGKVSRFVGGTFSMNILSPSHLRKTAL